MDDVQTITNIVLSYVELLDLGDLDGLSNLFARATVHTQGGAPRRGAEAFRDFIESGVQFYDSIPSTQHVVTNVMRSTRNATRPQRARTTRRSRLARNCRCNQSSPAGFTTGWSATTTVGTSSNESSTPT
jgi:hypothetical protein